MTSRRLGPQRSGHGARRKPRAGERCLGEARILLAARWAAVRCAGLARPWSPCSGAATRSSTVIGFGRPERPSKVSAYPTVAVNPAVLAKGGGCGTHAPFPCFQPWTTRYSSANNEASVVRQSSPTTPPFAALLGRLQRDSKTAPKPALFTAAFRLARSARFPDRSG